MRYELREYVDGEKSPFARWFNKLAPATAARIDKYLRRMAQGNLGDSKSVGGGVQELRIDYGPGYRVYYGRDGERLICWGSDHDKCLKGRGITAAGHASERLRCDFSMGLLHLRMWRVQCPHHAAGESISASRVRLSPDASLPQPQFPVPIRPRSN